MRLNGFIQTDDKLALKEIWRQLGREMEIEDDHPTSNHADTLTTLLALLSHPSEMSDSSTDQTTKSVIFVLDEFDLFTTHPRQTLLYNLFDIAQARKAPIVVLGLTTRVDVVESLEKRVKSRFSHRYVHLSLPRSIPAYWEICKEGLLGDSEEFATENHSAKNPGQDQFIAFWQSMIEVSRIYHPIFPRLIIRRISTAKMQHSRIITSQSSTERNPCQHSLLHASSLSPTYLCAIPFLPARPSRQPPCRCQLRIRSYKSCKVFRNSSLHF